MKKYIIALFLLFLLSACGNADNTHDDNTHDTVLPELEATEWQMLSTDAETFNLNGSFENPHFEYVFHHTDTVPLDQLAAFALAADAASEGAWEELRSRFLEAPNTVLTYLALLGDQPAELPGWEPVSAAEMICDGIASADAVWHDGSEEFAAVMTECRKTYPEGRIAELLNIMEQKHAETMERINAA